MKNFYNNGNKSGFSLIEMMVATAVFLVMVTMIGGIFRQTSSSWEAGYARAEGGMIVRGVIGTIQRELAGAVDGRRFEGVWTYNDPVHVTPNELYFICFKEPDKKTKNSAGLPSQREPHLVSYIWGADSMRRRDVLLQLGANGKWQRAGETSTDVYAEDRDSLYSAKFKFEVIEPPGYMNDNTRDFERVADSSDEAIVFSDEKFWTIPCVAIKLELTRTGSFSGLEVRSLGRNGIRDGTDSKAKDDDIISN